MYISFYDFLLCFVLILNILVLAGLDLGSGDLGRTTWKSKSGLVYNLKYYDFLLKPLFIKKPVMDVYDK